MSSIGLVPKHVIRVKAGNVGLGHELLGRYWFPWLLRGTIWGQEDGP
jgi:hypothetical protein